MILLFVTLMFMGPAMTLFFAYALGARPTIVAQLATYFIGISFLSAIALLAYFAASKATTIYPFISLNTLNTLLCSLILSVSFVVHRFSFRYVDGDRLYLRFFVLLSSLTFSALIMVISDNLFLFWSAWSISNILLVILMVHKKEWKAAKNAGFLAFYTLGLGSLCLFIAFIILALNHSTTSMSALIEQSKPDHLPILSISVTLILIAGIIQSGLFPFHKWLISSLNSPTPVSALMHAGLVNGGGILIVKFAPLMMLNEWLLNLLFVLGAFSACLGTIWKLMQHDIKKMLASSTMAQMGFMMMQCGVGLFAAAIAHICWHGLFKAYLFLNSGSVITNKKPEITAYKTPAIFYILSLVGGVISMGGFHYVTHNDPSLLDGSKFVLFFTFIAGSQLTLTWIKSNASFLGFLSSLIIALFSGFMYGFNIHMIEALIPSISNLKALPLSAIHWFVMILFGFLWIAFTFGAHKKLGESSFGCWLYMNLFNLSQPSRKTITTLRSDYTALRD